MKTGFISFALTAALMSFSPTTQARGYVDMHAHIACFGINSECYVGEQMREAWFRFKGLEFLFGISESEVRRRGGDHAIFGHISGLLGHSKRVKSSVILAFDQVYDPDGQVRKDLSMFYVPNDFVHKGTSQFSNLLYAASVHPYRKDAIEELERVERQGAMFIKLIPSIHRFHPDDPQIDNYWRKLAELNLPILIHVDDEGTFGEQHESYTGAYKMERALQFGVTVIVAHVATSGSSEVPESFVHDEGQEMMEELYGHKHHHAHKFQAPLLDHYQQLRILAERYDNLYVDVSALPMAPTRRYILLDIATDPVWKGKMLYGSDFPLNHWTLQSMYSFTQVWDQWRDNGVDPKEFWVAGGTELEQRWDRDIRLKEAFGLDESVFEFTETFFRRLGRL